MVLAYPAARAQVVIAQRPAAAQTLARSATYKVHRRPRADSSHASVRGISVAAALTWKTMAKGIASQGSFEGGQRTLKDATHRQSVTQFVWLRQTAPMPLGMLARRAAGTGRRRALLMAPQTTTRTRKCKTGPVRPAARDPTRAKSLPRLVRTAPPQPD